MDDHTDSATEWAERFWRRSDPAMPGDRPVAFGGSLTADTLVAAYRAGLLPMPTETLEGAEINAMLYGEQVRGGDIRVIGRVVADDTFDLAWWSPDPRPVLTAAGLHLGTSLTKTLRTRRAWHTTVDQAFDDVLAGCRVGREPRWLTDELAALLTDLHSLGWWHSVEVWSGARLVGGAVGIGFGGIFSCDTMFHIESGASQIALADLAVRLDDAAVLDLQWDQPHTRRLGARFVDRVDYVRLAAASTGQLTLAMQARPVDQLLCRLRSRNAATDTHSPTGTPSGWMEWAA